MQKTIVLSYLLCQNITETAPDFRYFLFLISFLSRGRVGQGVEWIQVEKGSHKVYAENI